jgi:peptidoglycan-associated lipoprotein
LGEVSGLFPKPSIIEMKKSTFFIALTMGAALMIGTSGCKHGPVDPTLIPGHYTNVPKPSGDMTGGLLTDGGQLPPGTEIKPNADGSIPNDPNSLANRLLKDGKQDREIFASDTVYFDTDSASIKAGEQSKLQHIADHFKGNTTEALLVEGYCDERGTEGYNMALGDRRALAVREYLVNLGVPAGSVTTVSFGEDKPVDPGHNEAAWKKNRRGVSVLLQPK